MICLNLGLIPVVLMVSEYGATAKFVMVHCTGKEGSCGRYHWTIERLTIVVNDNGASNYRSAGDEETTTVGVLDRYHRWAWITERF